MKFLKNRLKIKFICNIINLIQERRIKSKKNEGRNMRLEWGGSITAVNEG